MSRAIDKLIEALERSDYDTVTVDVGTSTESVPRKRLLEVLKLGRGHSTVVIDLSEHEVGDIQTMADVPDDAPELPPVDHLSILNDPYLPGTQEGPSPWDQAFSMTDPKGTAITEEDDDGPSE